MYDIGSVSKMLAAAAVMKLADQGLVDLDVPFSAYVPSFTTLSPAWRRITVRLTPDLLAEAAAFANLLQARQVLEKRLPAALRLRRWRAAPAPPPASLHPVQHIADHAPARLLLHRRLAGHPVVVLLAREP